MKKFIFKPDKKAGMMVNSVKDDINLDLKTMLGIKRYKERNNGLECELKAVFRKCVYIFGATGVINILEKTMQKNDTILDAADIDRILTRMTHEILEVHKGADNLALIGIQTRGVYLAKRIQSRINRIEGIEIPTGDMDITLYRDDWTRISHHATVKATDILFSVDGKQIILVDDVLFTGRTTRAAMDALVDFGRPDRIELAVLVDRSHRELPIQANYVGKFVETRRSETVNVLLSEHDGEDRVIIA